MKFSESLIAGLCGAGLSLLATHGTSSLILNTPSDGVAGASGSQQIGDETVAGEVVDLYDYMVVQDAAASRFARQDERLTFPERGPIGLIVKSEEEEEDGRHAGTDGVMHVIVFDPSDERARAAYHRLQQMPGESVTLDASLLERDGVLGCVIRKIEKEEASPAGPHRGDQGDQSQEAPL